MFDLDAYLERLGLDGRPDLSVVHRAHACSIPFENLDPQRGVDVPLDPEALSEKLIGSRRGGYCFEQNLLLAAALEALGARVAPCLARVRWGVPADVVTPRSHLVLRVELDGRMWHADVGFGAGTLLEPIPFGLGGPYEQSGWRFRVVGGDSQLMLQAAGDGEWRDCYEFSPIQVPHVDIEVANWFTSTHPRSRFVTGLIVSTQRPDGTRLALSDWDGLALTVRTPGETSVTEIGREAIPSLLEEHFGLAGFCLADDGKVALAATAY